MSFVGTAEFDANRQDARPRPPGRPPRAERWNPDANVCSAQANRSSVVNPVLRLCPPPGCPGPHGSVRGDEPAGGCEARHERPATHLARGAGGGRMVLRNGHRQACIRSRNPMKCAGRLFLGVDSAPRRATHPAGRRGPRLPPAFAACTPIPADGKGRQRAYCPRRKGVAARRTARRRSVVRRGDAAPLCCRVRVEGSNGRSARERDRRADDSPVILAASATNAQLRRGEP